MIRRVFILTVLLTACTDDPDVVPLSDAGPLGDATVDPCSPTSLGVDFGTAPIGPEPETWVLPPGAIVASTFIRLKPTEEAKQAFDDGNGPVVGELMAPAAGLLGLALGSSEQCGSSRTLTAWESEAAMMAFVTGPAHLRAMGMVGDVSRGGSVTGSWPADELGTASWENVAAQFADHTGPEY